MPKLKIKKGDTVLIQVGKDRGKVGKVLVALPKEGRLLIEGLNLVKKHVKPRKAGEKGQRIEVPSPLPVSRVMLVCPSCNKATRVGIQRGDTGLRQRVCKKCKVAIP